MKVVSKLYQLQDLSDEKYSLLTSLLWRIVIKVSDCQSTYKTSGSVIDHLYLATPTVYDFSIKYFRAATSI